MRSRLGECASLLRWLAEGRLGFPWELVELRTCWDLDIVVWPESLLLRMLGSEPWVSYRAYLRCRLSGDTERAAERRSLRLDWLLESVDLRRFPGDTERRGLW